MGVVATEEEKGAGYLVMEDGGLLHMAHLFLVQEQAAVPMVALLDACHSGAALRSGLLRHLENSMARVPRLTVLCATYDESKAGENDEEGLFTACLAEVLQHHRDADMHAEAVGRLVEREMWRRQGGGEERRRQVPCQRSFPEAANDELRRRFCFTFPRGGV